MTKRAVKRYTCGGIGLLLTVAAWVLFAPQQLGGAVAYTVVSGSSMEPVLRGEDLAIVRASSHYRPGDIVAYRSHHLHTIVLHRLVRRENGHLILKGDNNEWVDTDRPTKSDVVGKLWMRVPGAGRLLVRLQDPRIAALFVGLVTLVLFGFGGAKASREAPLPADRSGTTPHHGGTGQPEIT